jgi:hypothetical protein
MTKLRHPLSHHSALETAAELLGWPICCKIAERAERTVRDWSDPDIKWEIPLPVAAAIDRAVMETNPDAQPPFFAWYQAQVHLWRARGAAAMECAAQRLATAQREAGEAFAAHTLAAVPGANLRTRRRARRETEQAIVALALTLDVSADA